MPRRKKQSIIDTESAVNNVDDILTSEPSDTSDAEIVVDVAPPQKKSFADRLKSMVMGNDTNEDEDDKQPRMSAKSSNELATQLALLLALIFCLAMESVFREPYKEMAPTENEANAIMAPVGRIIGRRLKKSGRANPDTIDIIISVTAMVFWGNRARKTANMIYQQERMRVANEYANSNNGFNHVKQQAPYGYAGTYSGQNATTPEATGYGGHAHSATAQHGGTINQGDTGQGIDVADELLRADAIGRSERGIL